MAEPEIIFQARRLRRESTEAERKLWAELSSARLNGVKFRRQHPIGSYIVDFVSLERKLVVEVDGGGHNYDENQLRDKLRTEWLVKEGYRVIRFWNTDIINNIEGVADSIKMALEL